jgi:hypothetical protein
LPQALDTVTADGGLGPRHRRFTITQKLVTIYLDNSTYGKGKVVVGSYADKHGLVEEYLQADLKDGWTIKAVHGFGGSSEVLSVRGWIVVLLEK